MNAIIIFVVLLGFISVFWAQPISVKIIRDTNTLSANFNPSDLKPKSQASNFSGPTHLFYLVGKCFSYSSDKYEYRVCPFDNITQHEKVWHSGAYNGLLGVWKEWTVNNNSFDSLVFADGDDCEDNVQRSAHLVWICDQTNENSERVIEIKEPKKCFYEIDFVSDFGCEDKYIYPHLSDEYKRKWDRIETDFHYNYSTQLGYDSALRQLFIESKIIGNSTLEENKLNFESKEKCSEEYVLLNEQNVKLKQRVEFLENQLKNKIL